MRLWILAREQPTSTTLRLAELAEDAGHQVAVVRHEHVTVRYGYPRGLLGGVPDWWPDLVINRLRGDEMHLRHATRVQTAIEDEGVVAVNRAAAVAVASVKSATAGRIASSGLPQLLTVVCTVQSDPTDITAVTGVPLVIKADRGAGGHGIQKIDTADELPPAMAGMAAVGVRELVAQPYVPEGTTTLRAVVVGDRVVSTTARTAAAGEWRSSIDFGATVADAELTGPERALALAAARAVGLDIAGVDLLRVGTGRSATVVLEVNGSPQADGMAPEARDAMLQAMLDHAVRAARQGRSRR